VHSGPPERPFRGFRADSSSCGQPPPHQEQVGKGEEREQLSAVFGESAVAGFHVAELTLDHPEGMLDACPDHRGDAVDPRVDGMQVAALRRFAHDTPNLARCLERRLMLGADIALFGPDLGFLAVQQLVPDLAVVQFGHRGFQTVGHTAVGIDANVGLHAEIPVVALLRGRHLGVAGLGLGRGWRVDNRRVHQRARAQRDALVGQMCVTSAKIASVSPCRSRRWRKFRIVVSSGMRSSPGSIPTKRRIALLS